MFGWFKHKRPQKPTIKIEINLDGSTKTSVDWDDPKKYSKEELTKLAKNTANIIVAFTNLGPALNEVQTAVGMGVINDNDRTFSNMIFYFLKENLITIQQQLSNQYSNENNELISPDNVLQELT